MKRLLPLLLFGLVLTGNVAPAAAQVTAQSADSLYAVYLLSVVVPQPDVAHYVVAYAHLLEGTPYAAGSLDRDSVEQLQAHLQETDCTIFVETVLALARTAAKRERTWEAFGRELTALRYRDGRIDGYPSRLHYFSDWIIDNERRGNVKEMTAALDCLGLSKADVKQRPYAKSMWRLPQKVVVAGERCNPYLVFYTLDDGREMLYSYTYQYLGHSGEGGPYEEIEPLLNVLLPSAVALYGEPVVSSDPEYTLMDEQEREKMRQPDFVGFRYAEWHIGEKTKLTISAGGFYEGELTVHVDYTLENHLEQVASENAKIQEA